MGRRCVVWACALTLVVVGASSAQAERERPGKQLYRISVQGAVIAPLKSNGKYWDGFGVPKAIERNMNIETARKVFGYARKARRLLRIGAATTAAVALAAAAAYVGVQVLKKIKPPDPQGELMVDGRPVLMLPKVANSRVPKWTALASVPVAVGRGQRITLKLWDVDAGFNDAIGVCTWRHVKAGILVADHCSKPLLNAWIVAKPIGRTRASAGGAGARTISQIAVTAKPRKANGKAWDFGGGKPDLIVKVSVNGRVVHTCPHVKNTFSVVCNPRVKVAITPSTSIRVHIIDKDMMSNDSVGTASATGLTRRRPYQPIRMRTRGQVARATVTLSR